MSKSFSPTWIVAPYQREREHAVRAMNQGQAGTYHIDCHATLRGPYTGTGTLLRTLVPEIYPHWPDLVIAHGTEILSIAPELKALVSVSKETLTSLAIPEERTRFYSRMRTLRLAHGVVDFLLAYLDLAQRGPVTIVFENVHAADILDQEFLSVLLRRADPAQLSLIISSAPTTLTEPLLSALTARSTTQNLDPLTLQEQEELLATWQLPTAWGQWLQQHSLGWRGEWQLFQDVAVALPYLSPPTPDLALPEGLSSITAQFPATMRTALAQAYVDSDCTSDHLLQIAAYDLMDATVRQQMHDARAAVLEQQDAWTLRLGAIPYHREHGPDPTGLGAKALQVALDYCINMGYYEATVDLGRRGRRVIDWKKQLDEYWTFTTKMTTSLAALGRPVDAETLYEETRELTDDPWLHMQAAYATSMLYTRHHEPGKRDHHIAKRWIQQAIAIASILPDPKDRAFNTVFNQNGLALIEVHLGHPQEALRLVTGGLERLNRELEPGEHMLHRSVLLYNRAQVYAGLGQLEPALADYTAVITQDPHYSEYYFDRGSIYRRLGRNEEALADYNAAIEYSPPYPEAYYNRAGVLSVLGHEDEALADYSYVLELDPTYIDALVNRASILYERGVYDASRLDVEHGLAFDAGNAQLLCTLGLLEIAEGHPDKAHQALTAAVERDPKLLAAWTNRAVLAFENGNVEAAIADLTHALEISENATVRYNRGLAYQSQGRWHDAINDYSRALELSDEDAHDLLYQRGVCYTNLDQHQEAHRDFEAHLALGESPYLADILQLDPSLAVRQAVTSASHE